MIESPCLLTGGSGFLGRAILRRSKRENWPIQWIVYSRDEYKQAEVKRFYPDTICILGDIARDLDRLTSVMSGCKSVLHLGAVKFIPDAEHNVSETIDVNVIGSRNVSIAARVAEVKTVVGISTDKACAPLNIYGMTKGIMERLLAEANRMGLTRFTTARYGNVIGSTGSVIPVFKKQIADYQEIRVTDSRMTRFWLTVDEAIDLIIWAHDEAANLPGHTFIAPCPAMSIADIARAVWEMERPGTEPNIKYTGIRPGEKLHEALFNEQEAPRITVQGDKGFTLAPATTTGVIMPERMSYTSDQPRRWITPSEMISYIRDAETV